MRPHFSHSWVSLAVFTMLAGCGMGSELDGVTERAQALTSSDVIDQEFTGPVHAQQPLGPTRPIAQIITAGRSGKLSRVSIKAAPCLPAWERTGTSCYFNLQVKTVNGEGEPDTLLTEQRSRQPLPPEDGSAFAWTDVVFSTPANIQAGVKYALELIPEFGMFAPLGSGYAGGVSLQWQPSYHYWAGNGLGDDILFRTYVKDVISVSDFRSGDANPDGVDWDVGYYKGGCGAGAGMIGFSQVPYSGARAALCLFAEGFSHQTTAVLKLDSGSFRDQRRAARLGDWDVGKYKLECGSNEYVSGVSQAPGYLRIHGVRCATGTTQSGACEVRSASGPTDDQSGGLITHDWSVDAFKGQCPAGEYMAGVSVHPTLLFPSKILCCQG